MAFGLNTFGTMQANVSQQDKQIESKILGITVKENDRQSRPE